MFLSVALMLRYSLSCPEVADALEQAVFHCWESGVLTRDLVKDGHTTAQVTASVCERLASAHQRA
jgi:isocitrate/isopropylmalate dehydrogenase